jgi:chorismate-pyruvate lyase
MVRIHLDQVPDRVRDLILEEKIPLGRLLIDQGVLRRVERTALFSYPARPIDRERFALGAEYPPDTRLFGRLALLHCDGKPAIELLEVVRPASPAGGAG